MVGRVGRCAGRRRCSGRSPAPSAAAARRPGAPPATRAGRPPAASAPASRRGARRCRRPGCRPRRCRRTGERSAGRARCSPCPLGSIAWDRQAWTRRLPAIDVPERCPDRRPAPRRLVVQMEKDQLVGDLVAPVPCVRTSGQRRQDDRIPGELRAGRVGRRGSWPCRCVCSQDSARRAARTASSWVRSRLAAVSICLAVSPRAPRRDASSRCVPVRFAPCSCA